MEFTIARMSCGACARAVTNAVQGVDPAAKVDVDLGDKRVSIDTAAQKEDVRRAIEQAGYEILSDAA